MLKILAIALVAVGLIAAPALAQNGSTNTAAPAAQTQVKQVKPAKTQAKHAAKKSHTKQHQSSRKHHVKHVRLHKPAANKAG